MTNKNVKLQEKLSKKDKEISDLQDRIQSMEQALNSITLECSAVSSQKIADLSKSNRNLNSKLLSVTTKYREMEDNYHRLERQLESKINLLKEYEKPKNQERPPSPTEIQILTENLEKTKRKLFEAENSNLQLRNELKMAHKCLQNEIGCDSINLSQILNSNSNWRGRSQQIQMLQSKISELKEKLDSIDSDSFDISNLPLKRLESVRRMEISSLTEELNDCKNELNELRSKVSALKTRNKNLTDEVTNYKVKTLDLMEKSKNDDDLVKCLNEKISMIKFECEHKLSEKEKEMAKIEQSSNDTKLKSQKLECDLNDALHTLSDKEQEIANLKSLNEELENNLRGISGDFLFSCRNMNNHDYVNLVKTLEQEKNHLLDMIEELNKRLNKQSVLESDQHDIISKHRIKISRLEAKIKELENEKEAERQKHRRGIRINEYSRTLNGMNVNNRPSTKSNEKLLSEIDRLKFK